MADQTTGDQDLKISPASILGKDEIGGTLISKEVTDQFKLKTTILSQATKMDAFLIHPA